MAGSFRTLLLLVVVFLSAIGYADGCFLKRSGFREAEPSIPHQRAVIKWRDGLEYLFVQSDLSAPAGDYAWLIPLPSPPLYAKASMPAYFDRAFAKSLPNRVQLPWGLFGGFALFVIAVTMSALTTPRPPDANPWLTALVALLAAGALLAIFFPVFAQSKEAAKGRGAIVQTIGSYEVAVLQGRGREAFDWLVKNGYHPPAEAQRVMEVYAKEGWCFVAAKLRKKSERTLPPHPIKLVFKAPIPIYPMRLTAAMGKAMRLELVVVADQAAKCEQLETWAASEKRIVVTRPRENQPELISTFESEWVDRAYQFAGDGDIVSYLRADLTPSQMQKDYLIEWTGREPVVSSVYSLDDYRVAWFGMGSVLTALAFLGLVPLRSKWKLIGHGVGWHFVAALSIGLLLTAFWLGPAHVVDIVGRG